jgi:hypothetical protein
MPSELQRVAEQLLACLNEAPRAVGYLHDRARKCREAAAWIGNQSSNPSARVAAMQLDEAARRCEDAAHYLSLAEARAKQWVEQMVSGVRTVEPSGGSTGGRPLGPGGSTWPAERRRDDKGDEPEASKADKTAEAGDETSPEDGPRLPRITDEEVRRIFERLPIRKPGEKTRGVWRDSEGTDHDLISGQHEDDFHTAQRHAEKLGLVRAPHKLSTAADVELKFAMRMRREGIRHAEIVLNNRPCGGRLGCDRLLKLFLPPDASLTIHAPNGFKKTYPEPDQE